MDTITNAKIPVLSLHGTDNGGVFYTKEFGEWVEAVTNRLNGPPTSEVARLIKTQGGLSGFLYDPATNEFVGVRDFQRTLEPGDIVLVLRPTTGAEGDE